MEETLLPLKLPPGILRNGTDYQSKGRWFDCNGVRFRSGAIQPIGGWRRLGDSGTGADMVALTGVPRAAKAWRDRAGQQLFAVGTTSGLYLVAGGALQTAITPSGFTAGAVNSGGGSSAGGYGSGPYGIGNFGTGSLAASFVPADTWTLDTFGDYLFGVCTSDHKLYVWKGAPASPAITASTDNTAGTTPTCLAVVTTAERFVVALGAYDAGLSAINGRYIKWASQEGYTDWDLTSVTNTAGDFTLTTDGVIKCGKKIKGGTLILTDLDAWVMLYIGGTFIHSFQRVGDHCGVIAPNAVVVIDSRAAWMGKDAFYVLDGYVQAIPCDVNDYVFGDINMTQSAKFFAETHAEFGEIWWRYVSGSSTEIDRYVIWNYQENHWSIGQQVRTASATDGPGLSPEGFPLAVDAAGVIWEHEVLDARTGMTAFLKSGPVELGNGEQVMKIQRIVPDEKTIGDLTVTLETSFFPTDTPVVNGPYTLLQPTNVRLTARQVRVAFTEGRAVSWRVGHMRLGGRIGGNR